MPELPEVETTRASIAPVLEGARIARVEVRRERMVRHQEQPSDFAARLVSRTILNVARTGKFIVTALTESGDGPAEATMLWVTHLGMSGRVALATPGEAEAPHTNVVLDIERDGAVVEWRLIDPRTFGYVWALTPEEMAASSLALLGPDAHIALPRTPRLAAELAGRTAPIKALLLDQRIVAGLGNIYADEALFRGRVAPTRPGGSLDAAEVARLRKAIKVSLDAGLRWGGTTLEDRRFLLPDGRAGGFIRKLNVYGRTGQPCRRCGTPIARIELRGRGTHFCPTCQR
ncbi:MAG: bifunctional DNA-formamidopyrimidine glycosylase/DNA-(apurinic or apyrimidinic site) lyase [Acidimicrobiia bacterium]|nr:bifunctional DNA-formamidopyrimidine glycosylase/DNA-(apurinic or apyrimidinic site) lyase [Acidimicrobiia bacterium]